MYVPNPQFETPADDVNLWRYMDVARFVALLDSKALYFARLFELNDRWEAARPSGLKQRLGARVHWIAHYRLAAKQAVVSCWHQNDNESVAMWRLYTSGAEGIAIKTTIGQLKSALVKEPRSVTIGKVEYIDHETDDDGTAPRLNVLGPIFCKRQSFLHEREVRVVIANPHDLTCPSTLRERGLVVPVDLPVLVQRIVVSPQFPDWALKALQRVIQNSGLAVTAELSDLIKKP